MVLNNKDDDNEIEMDEFIEYDLLDNNTINIRDECLALRTYQFAMAGINIHDVITEDDFKKAAHISFAYMEEAMIWDARRKNKHLGNATSLFIELINSKGTENEKVELRRKVEQAFEKNKAYEERKGNLIICKDK